MAAKYATQFHVFYYTVNTNSVAYLRNNNNNGELHARIYIIH